MKKSVELPVVKPVYSTYHYQGNGSAILLQNLSIRNWYLNEVLLLTCSTAFLKGRTTPDLGIKRSFTVDNPYLDRHALPMQYLGGHVHPIIRTMLDNGYYVAFHGIDDYYVTGKSWYKEKHFNHDGLICGYDQNEKTYSLFAYDQQWVYRVFKTPQRAFDNGRKAMFQHNQYGAICALKPKMDPVDLQPASIYRTLADYLNSSLTKYPPDKSDTVVGIAVHDYILLYLDKLANGSIPYERLDSRIWEHKVVMRERICAVENALDLSHEISHSYEMIVTESNAMRMLYAAHHRKRHDSVLPVIRETLQRIRKKEELLLIQLMRQMERSGIA